MHHRAGTSLKRRAAITASSCLNSADCQPPQGHVTAMQVAQRQVATHSWGGGGGGQSCCLRLRPR